MPIRKRIALHGVYESVNLGTTNEGCIFGESKSLELTFSSRRSRAHMRGLKTKLGFSPFQETSFRPSF